MILYHASQKKNLKVIKPQPTLSNNKLIGNYVFATANKILAIMYLVPKGIAILVEPNGLNPNIVICSDIEEFKKKDIGGVIYELPSETFIKTPQKGLTDYEMVSKKGVKP